MPIIDEAQYNAIDKLQRIHNSIILRFGIKHNQKKKLQIMLRENNIRPRKSPWTINNSTPLLKIGEFQAYGKETKSSPVVLPVEGFERSDSKIHKSNLDTSKRVAKVMMHQITTYCDKSTLHGLRYLGDTSLSLGERCFWLIAILSAFAFAAYYISNIFDKWNSNPVLIAFSPFDANMNQIPFPAITICNMNQAKKTEALRIISNGKLYEKRLLYDSCNDENTFANDSDEAPSWSMVQDFLIKVGQTCSDNIKSCTWKNEKVKCDDFFNNYLTDDGLCCSFNRLPPEIIFRNPNDVSLLNQTYPNNTYNWSPEIGFIDENVGDPTVRPLRPVGAGTHLGLTLVVDAQVDNYYCSSTDSFGFKVLFSNPIETPRVADFAYLVPTGTEQRFIIQPDIRESTTSLRTVSIDKRQCFFQNERPLFYFRAYTIRNCLLECQSNHTLNKCGCIPYYLPRSKDKKICGKSKEMCALGAKEDMELIYGNGASCNCLPSCFEMIFDKSATSSKLLKFNRKYDIDNITDEYFLKNMAVFHFFFKDTKFRKQIKSEIYGFTEALSNIGGLLGLCLGFSFLSLVEIVYFVTLRLLCGVIRKMRKNRVIKIDHNVNNGAIPFMK